MYNISQFVKRHAAVFATLAYAVFLLAVLQALVYVEALPIPLELWDNVATVGWSCLPVVMCCTLWSITGNVREYRTAKVALIDSQAELNSALADKAEADTWATRTHTKAFRNQN